RLRSARRGGEFPASDLPGQAVLDVGVAHRRGLDLGGRDLARVVDAPGEDDLPLEVGHPLQLLLEAVLDGAAVGADDPVDLLGRQVAQVPFGRAGGEFDLGLDDAAAVAAAARGAAGAGLDGLGRDHVVVRGAVAAGAGAGAAGERARAGAGPDAGAVT